ncbi:MAG: DUF4870 domain-containing protein [Acidobacteriota bacterium]|nr:DUF4870 domain-containing protein [Acidobacteriota bacterium]
MSEKRSKYDTDPLDPEFARQTEEVWGGETKIMGDAPTGDIAGATRPMPPGDQSARMNPDSDAPTQLIDEKLAQPYPSINVPPAYTPPRPNAYQPPPSQGFAPPPNFPPAYTPPPSPYAPTAQAYQQGPRGEHNVAGVGIPEKWTAALPYAPFYIGLVVSIIELLIVPRSEQRTRFHASQALGLHIGIIVVSFALRVVAMLGGGGFGGFLFWLASFIFLIYSFVRVWRGDHYRIPPLADATRWLDTSISPKK